MFYPKERIATVKRYISHLRKHKSESEDEFESRRRYASAYLSNALAVDESEFPLPDRHDYGLTSRTATQTEKWLIKVLTGTDRQCSSCREPLTDLNSSPSILKRGGRCKSCESDYYYKRTGTDRTTKIPITARFWVNFTRLCTDLGKDPLMEARITLINHYLVLESQLPKKDAAEPKISENSLDTNSEK